MVPYPATLVAQQVTSLTILHTDDALSYHCAEKDSYTHDWMANQSSMA